MPGLATPVPNRSDPTLRRNLIAIYGLLIGANVLVWLWALFALRDRPILLGSALLAYTFGLRHAVDADHIAAIDNVMRRFMQRGQRPLGVGFFFALGHSLVVVLLSVGLVFATSALASRFDGLKAVGRVIGTGASALFLFGLAIVNIAVFVAVARIFRAVRLGGRYDPDDLDHLLDGRGVLARLFRPLFALVSKSWHLLIVGFLFGLGFDTATEVALFGLSSAQSANGLSFGTVMVFPALFTAGMSLVDTTDGVLMLGAYGWAFDKPVRKLYYNMTMTAVSVVLAVLIGGIETLGLVGDQFALKGPVWTFIGQLNDHFGWLGAMIIGLFIAIWLGSMMIYRLRRYDTLDAGVGAR